MFIVSIIYTSSIDKIDEFLEDHVSYLDGQYALGNFLLSGRKEPRIGGIIISSVTSRTELDSILEQDPFYRENLASYEVTKIIPTKATSELEYLLET